MVVCGGGLKIFLYIKLYLFIMSNGELGIGIVRGDRKPSRQISILGEDIKKIALELKDYPIATFEDGKKVLNVDTESRVLDAFEILTIAGHIAAFTGKVPVISETKFGKKVVNWISLEEAKKKMDKALAEEYFAQKARDRVPEEVRSLKLEVRLRGDIKEKIEEVKRKYREIL